jgi:hypothetical protein
MRIRQQGEEWEEKWRLMEYTSVIWGDVMGIKK